MPVRIKRAYEKPDQSDGFRVLVDRIWPRGVSKEDAQIDHWEKAVAPSNDLRKWFGHDPNKFQEFKEKYKAELASGDQHESLEALKQLTKRNHGISLMNRIVKLKQTIYGWVNYFKLAKMKKILANIDAKLRSRIRVIIWKQWKSNKKRIKALIQLGIPEEEAKGLTYCRKGYRFIGLSKVIHRALSNKRLKQRGIPFALDYYLEVHTTI